VALGTNFFRRYSNWFLLSSGKEMSIPGTVTYLTTDCLTIGVEGEQKK
jgi:hypothetical protein